MDSSWPLRALFRLVALGVSVAAVNGCVASRPSRNGVFDENQYLRKDFLVQPAGGGGDPGWFMKATIVQTSTPNPLAKLDLFTGAENGGISSAGSFVRFAITSDKLSIEDAIELSQSSSIGAQSTRTPSVDNAWSVTNVDLKYRVNLDGEKTNYYEENQELDWQVRQWVKVSFDKNDFSDVAALGPYATAMLSTCGDVADSSATLVPGSFQVDEAQGYMQWTVAVTVPLDLGGKTNSSRCLQAYGSVGQDFIRLNRSNVTLNVMYSFTRARPVDATVYTPLVVPELDPIRHKYGTIQNTLWNRDDSSGLLAATQSVLRFNPGKPIVWYLAKGYPSDKFDMWKRPGGIQDQTNAVLKAAGAAARVLVLAYDDDATFGDGRGPARQYGDIRYNMIRWESDLDTDSPFLGVTQFQPDPRTGELTSASITIADAPLKDFVGERIALYLSKVSGSDVFANPPPDPANPGATLPIHCTSGQSVPIAPAAVQSTINANSSLFQRMAQYLGPPADRAASPGPSDYVYPHTGSDGATFYSAYLALIPFTTYADPALNQFVTPASGELAGGVTQMIGKLDGEAQFQQAMSDLDHGTGGLPGLTLSGGPQGIAEAYGAIDRSRQLLQAHRDYKYTWQLPHSKMRGDTADLVSFSGTMARSSRRCVNGAWESRSDWEKRLLTGYYESVVWHEFGHALGLEHNFMGSVDKANWPTYTDAAGATQFGKYSSSIMEYSVTADDAVWNDGAASTGGPAPTTGWLPYDRGAIAWVYGNNLSRGSVGPVAAAPAPGQRVGASGQVSARAPWNDPLGWDGGKEKAFLFCSEEHVRYTPLCRPFDLGSTPSEITAADIEAYEWNYNWRNFRQYYKTWDDSPYATRVADMITDTRRFLAMWRFDWSATELTDKLIQVGIDAPAGSSNAGLFYQQLTDEFQADVGAAEQLIAAFHEAVIQQSTGQRPYATSYDPYYGEVTQQGIAVDKQLAFTNWLGLWPYDDYDPTQANGFLGSAMTIGPGQGQPSQAWSTAGSMLGEKGVWDAYPQFFPTAVALFAHDTNTPSFNGLGYPQMREWIGGQTFSRQVDALAYFRLIAAQNPTAPNGCTDLATCSYDPTQLQVSTADVGHSNPTTHAFVDPAGRRWTWVYLADRNTWFFCDQDRNSSSYVQVVTYNTDVFVNFGDGNPGGPPVFVDESSIKYLMDAYALYHNDTTTP